MHQCRGQETFRNQAPLYSQPNVSQDCHHRQPHNHRNKQQRIGITSMTSTETPPPPHPPTIPAYKHEQQQYQHITTITTYEVYYKHTTTASTSTAPLTKERSGCTTPGSSSETPNFGTSLKCHKSWKSHRKHKLQETAKPPAGEAERRSIES